MTIPVAARAKKLGTRVSFDLERLQSTMDAQTRDTLLSLADLVFPNEEGLFSYTGCGSVEDGARTLLRKGPGIVVVTRGAQGVEVFTDTLHIAVPALGENVVDTTGAGDTFNGAFLAALCKGYSLHDCAWLASASAAEQISAIGCRTKLSSEAHALDFLHRRGFRLHADE